MKFKGIITLIMSLCLAFSVSTAMAGKSDKSDKSDKSAKYSQKSDKSAKSGKGKKGKKSDKSGKSDKSDKSDKSGKSGKSEKPTACVTSFSFSGDEIDGESGFYLTGVLSGTVCTETELLSILDAEYSPAGQPDTVCVFDEESGGGVPDPGVDGTYELMDLPFRCETNDPTPPPPQQD